MRRKILAYFLVFSVILTAAIITLVSVALSSAYNRRMEESLRSEALRLSASLDMREDDVSYLTGSKYIGIRVTLIAPDGTVLFENFVSGENLQNHSDRAEVITALKDGTGSSTRYSETLGEEYTYYAVRLSSGSVLRVSESRRTTLGLIADMRSSYRWIILAAFVLSLWLSLPAARSIVKPINDIDPDAPEKSRPYSEIAPLLTRIARQREEIRLQLSEMESRQRRMIEITENMQEGLILLDTHENVLSMNKSAYRLLDIHNKDAVARHILEIDRSEPMRRAMEDAKAGQRAEAVLACSGHTVEVLVSPVQESGSAYGYVLLLVDITEKTEAEMTRREFSANVSHELKTPLTSISGYAEIMKNGITRPEDTVMFAGRIYSEAQRLIALVEDILRLSRLDEGGPEWQREKVDLLELAEEVISRYGDAARARNVKLSSGGEHLRVSGVRQVLFEVLSNLVDNAVKYNTENGSAVITVSRRGKGAALIVSDTGIGIEKMHHERIFERFYRVDKSRSRTAGGTGLGLSIVKHGARLHGAEIELDSKPGRGTSITIVFRDAEQLTGT